jgi:hypothetical protein
MSIVEIFESVVGLPICTEGAVNKDPLDIITRFYKPQYHLMSYNKKL